MTLRTLIESLHRLYTDPRVSPNTEVEIEFIYKTDHYFETKDGIFAPQEETIREREALRALSVASANCGRSVILSVLDRDDAIAR